MKERIEQVRSKLGEWEVDGLIVKSLVNGRWLSGFTGSNITLVITAEQALIGTDFRYWEQATQQAPDFELVKMGRTDDLTSFGELIGQTGVETFGVEANRLTLADFSTMKKDVEKAEVTATFKPLNSVIEPMRGIKTAEEVEKIRRAAAITDFAMSQVNEIAQVGMTERELAWELEMLMRDQGADGIAFDIIVASGRNGALAHHHPGNRELQAGDAIVIDMGAKLDGYHSDLTRSFYLGNEPDEQFWKVYNLVLEAQTNSLEKMKAGMTGAEIDSLARDVIAEAGHGPDFGHSLGHSLGLEIHERPSFSQAWPHPVPAGTIMTVEPGVYLPEWGGIRIEDLVILTEDGVEFISHCPKTPVIPV